MSALVDEEEKTKKKVKKKAEGEEEEEGKSWQGSCRWRALGISEIGPRLRQHILFYEIG